MIQTPNLNLKKWQSSDLVTDMLTWLNTNNDAIDAAAVKFRDLQSITNLLDLKAGTYVCNNSNGWPLRPSGSGVYGLLQVYTGQGYYFVVYADSNGRVYHGFFSAVVNIIWKQITSTTV